MPKKQVVKGYLRLKHAGHHLCLTKNLTLPKETHVSFNRVSTWQGQLVEVSIRLK